jgi:hypothetical protein
MDRRVGSRGQRGVSDDRFGIGMPVVRVSKYDAIFQQVIESAFAKAFAVSERQVTSQLINRDLQNEFRLRHGLGAGTTRRNDQ